MGAWASVTAKLALCTDPAPLHRAWDVAWADRELVNEIFDTQHMDSHQKVNHYRNCREVCGGVSPL